MIINRDGVSTVAWQTRYPDSKLTLYKVREANGNLHTNLTLPQAYALKAGLPIPNRKHT